MRDFLQELKRRNVFRVGVAYVVIAWVLAQAAELVPDHQLPVTHRLSLIACFWHSRPVPEPENLQILQFCTATTKIIYRNTLLSQSLIDRQAETVIYVRIRIT